MTLSSIKRRGLMLVLSSPSGAGKTSIARELLAIDNNLQMSVSATTRPRRPGEVHGIDYEFVEPNKLDCLSPIVLLLGILSCLVSLNIVAKFKSKYLFLKK